MIAGGIKTLLAGGIIRDVPPYMMFIMIYSYNGMLPMQIRFFLSHIMMIPMQIRGFPAHMMFPLYIIMIHKTVAISLNSDFLRLVPFSLRKRNENI